MARVNSIGFYYARGMQKLEWHVPDLNPSTAAFSWISTLCYSCRSSNESARQGSCQEQMSRQNSDTDILSERRLSLMYCFRQTWACRDSSGTYRNPPPDKRSTPHNASCAFFRWHNTRSISKSPSEWPAGVECGIRNERPWDKSRSKPILRRYNKCSNLIHVHWCK